MNCNLTTKSEEILEFIFSNMQTVDLLKYSKQKHGFVADEGAYWVLYSSDLDEYEKEVEGHKIPDGMVEIYQWAMLDEGEVILLPLADYLCALNSYIELEEKKKHGRV